VTRCIALLRGINVGGNRKVDMKELKAAFEDASMGAVRTYINSGNVIFSTKMRSRTKLTGLLEDAIADRFGFSVEVLLRELGELKAVAEALPADWVNDSTMKCDVMFLWKEADTPQVLEQLNVKPDIEDVRYVAGAVLWRVDKANVTRSGMMKLAGTPLYKQMTIRNCNTVRKLVALAEQTAAGS
jgi:uncharacterized protein (DUF1697 family)